MARPYSTLSATGNEKLTLEQIKRKRALADALMSRGFKATQVGQGGSYTPFAGLADALSASLGTWRGNRDNQALDAREAELAAQAQARQDTHANLFDAQDAAQGAAQGSPTLAETQQPLGRGPVPIPEPDAPTTNPMHEELARALKSTIPEIVQSPAQVPLPPPPTSATKSIAEALQNTGKTGQPPIPLGEYSHSKRDTPNGFPLASDYALDERAQLALTGMSPEEMDKFQENEESAQAQAHPDYGVEMQPPGNATMPADAPMGQLGTGDVLGMRAVGSELAPQPVPGTGQPPPSPQPALLDAMKAQPAAAQQSPTPSPELVQAMMSKLGLSMPAPPAAAPPQAPQSPTQAPRQSTDDRWIRLWKSSVAVGDKDGMKFALERMDPEQKKYVIDGALVDSTGKEIYKGQAKLDHVDLGDKIGFFDKQGNLIRTEEKGKLPPEQLRTLDAIMEAQGVTDKKSAEYQAAYRALQNKLTTHQPPLVDMTTKLETKESQAKGEYNVKDYYKPVKEAAAIAKKSNFQLTALEGLNFKTGWGAQAKGYAANVLASFGIAPEQAKEYASDSQAFLSIMQDQILQKQLAQKGPQTESDAKRMQQAGVQLSNTPQANAFIIAVAKAQNNRDIEKGNFLERYWSQNKTFEGGEDAWDAAGGAKSLFDDPAMKKFSKLGATEGNDKTVTESTTPPKELPSGTTFNGYSAGGNRLWRLPNGKVKEELE